MKRRTRFAVVGLTGLIPLAAGLLAARGPAADPGAAPAPAPEILIAHALSMAIDGTSAHLTARSIATLPDRKKDQAKGALEAMRQSARSSYQDSGKLFNEARIRLAGSPGNSASRRFYDAALAYTKTMWELSDEATPTTDKKESTEPTGKLSIDDLATLETINQNVRAALGAFLLKQLTLRAQAPGDEVIKTLDKHAGSMAKASKKASASFPKVPEALLAQAKAELKAAKAEKDAAKQEKAAAKKLAKTAKRLQSRAGTEEAKEEKQEAKQEKKQAGAREKAAKKEQQKATKAQAKEIGAEVRASVQELGRQGRAIILLLDPMIEGAG